jgi:hypothetical protein
MNDIFICELERILKLVELVLSVDEVDINEELVYLK